MVLVISTGIKSPKEVDRVKEAATAELAAVEVMIAETTQ